MENKKSIPMSATERILASARKEFTRHGLEGARVDRIASRAKVNKAMIYYYFRSKENLYQAVIANQLDKIGTLLKEDITQEDNPESLFYKLAEFYNSMFDEGDDFVPMFLREMASGEKG